MKISSILPAIAVVVLAVAAAIWWSVPPEVSPPAVVATPVSVEPPVASPTAAPFVPSFMAPASVPRTAMAAPAVAAAAPTDDLSDEQFRHYDADVSAGTIPRWWGQKQGVYTEVSAVDPGSSVSGVTCSSRMCRVEIYHSNPESRKDFAERAMEVPSFQDGVLFRQPPDDPNKTFAYVMPPRIPLRDGSEEEVRAAIAQMIEQTRD